MREVTREGYICGGGSNLYRVCKKGFMEKMVTGRSLEALDLELFMFLRLAFPKTLEKSSRMVKCIVKGLAHLK